ncbi:hypothetical protein JOQ06_023755 [Pogonophryne albipinna]|uniref:Uncharacterized protein n=1 Tax=Pogonophryne albipinna TaxID=1090488 RepID=A0AAD6BPV1_9TELE|nr:hypothetical protein JOQ06_023755 [Pogonophryne albipinna]
MQHLGDRELGGERRNLPVAVSGQRNKQPHSTAARMNTLSMDQGGRRPPWCFQMTQDPTEPLQEFSSLSFYCENVGLCSWTSPEERLVLVGRHCLFKVDQ